MAKSVVSSISQDLLTGFPFPFRVTLDIPLHQVLDSFQQLTIRAADLLQGLDHTGHPRQRELLDDLPPGLILALAEADPQELRHHRQEVRQFLAAEAQIEPTVDVNQSAHKPPAGR